MIKLMLIFLLGCFQSYSQTYSKSGIQNGNNNLQNNTFIINKSDSSAIVKGIDKLLKKFGYDNAQFKLTATAINNGNTMSFALTNNDNHVIGNNNHVVFGDNPGINGDYIVGNTQRHLNSEQKIKLLKRIEDTIKQNNLTKTIALDFISPIGNAEGYNFVKEIIRFLRDEGYNVSKTIEMSIDVDSFTMKYIRSENSICIYSGLEGYP